MEHFPITLLDHTPTIEERVEIARTFQNLSSILKDPITVVRVDAGYVVIETGTKQFKNAISLLQDGLAFYTTDDSLRRLFEEHGIEPTCEPMKNEESAHNRYRYLIPHVSPATILKYRPLFLTMLHDSVSYVQDQANA